MRLPGSHRPSPLQAASTLAPTAHASGLRPLDLTNVHVRNPLVLAPLTGAQQELWRMAVGCDDPAAVTLREGSSASAASSPVPRVAPMLLSSAGRARRAVPAGSSGSKPQPGLQGLTTIEMIENGMVDSLTPLRPEAAAPPMPRPPPAAGTGAHWRIDAHCGFCGRLAKSPGAYWDSCVGAWVSRPYALR